MGWETTAEKLRVLVIDDDGRVYRLLRQMLTQIGISEIEILDDGAQSRERLLRKRKDLLFCHFGGSATEAAAFARRLRQDPEHPNHDIPMIAVINQATKQGVSAGLDAGVDSFLVHPFAFTWLRRHIDHVLERRRKAPERGTDSGLEFAGAAE